MSIKVNLNACFYPSSDLCLKNVHKSVSFTHGTAKAIINTIGCAEISFPLQSCQDLIECSRRLIDFSDSQKITYKNIYIYLGNRVKREDSPTLFDTLDQLSEMFKLTPKLITSKDGLSIYSTSSIN